MASTKKYQQFQCEFPHQKQLRASYLSRAILAAQLLLLLSPHYALRALVQFVLGQRDGQLQQELLVDRLQVVERHPIKIDYGIENIVE